MLLLTIKTLVITLVIIIISFISYRYNSSRFLVTLPWDRSRWWQLLAIFGSDYRHFSFVNSSKHDHVLSWKFAYSTCNSLERQSPINYNSSIDSVESQFFIRVSSSAHQPPILDLSSWKKSSLIQFNPVSMNDITEGFAFDANENEDLIILFQEQRYKTHLVKIRTPSDHHVDANFFPVEVQFYNYPVTQSDNGKYIVDTLSDELAIGFFFDLTSDENEKSTFVQSIIDSLNSFSAYFSSTTLDLKQFIDTEASSGREGEEYLIYKGSHTEPPCTENIIWIHFARPLKLSINQWQDIRRSIGFNSRPTQPRRCAIDSDACAQSLLRKGDPRNWNYHGNNGLDLWNLIFPMCSGEQQSPIDVGRTRGVHDLAVSSNSEEGRGRPKPINWYAMRYARIQRNPGRISIDVTENVDGSGLPCLDSASECKGREMPVTIVNGKKGRRMFGLVNIHYHIPGEHQVNRMYHPLELHFVHKVEDGNDLMVIGFMVEISSGGETSKSPGRDLKFFNELASFASTNLKQSVRDFDLSVFAAHLERNKLVNYPGSLTIPPCTEGVEWFLVDQVLYVSLEQWKSLAIAFNARPSVLREL